jgi:hypothetical protein
MEFHGGKAHCTLMGLAAASRPAVMRKSVNERASDEPGSALSFTRFHITARPA